MLLLFYFALDFLSTCLVTPTVLVTGLLALVRFTVDAGTDLRERETRKRTYLRIAFLRRRFFHLHACLLHRVSGCPAQEKFFSLSKCVPACDSISRVHPDRLYCCHESSRSIRTKCHTLCRYLHFQKATAGIADSNMAMIKKDDRRKFQLKVSEVINVIKTCSSLSRFKSSGGGRQARKSQASAV